LKKKKENDPYKQSVDILNNEPFENIREGEDEGSAKA